MRLVCLPEIGASVHNSRQFLPRAHRARQARALRRGRSGEISASLFGPPLPLEYPG